MNQFLHSWASITLGNRDGQHIRCNSSVTGLGNCSNSMGNITLGNQLGKGLLGKLGVTVLWAIVGHTWATAVTMGNSSERLIVLWVTCSLGKRIVVSWAT